MTDEPKKKRGRPPLSPEAKAESLRKKTERANEWHKKNGYLAQKKHQQNNPEKYKNYKKNFQDWSRITLVHIPAEKRESLIDLLSRENTDITNLFVGLVLEKYGVDLSKDGGN